MLFHPGQLIRFLGNAAKDNTRDLAKELTKAQRDLAWHTRALDVALREAARGHARDTIIRNHEYGKRIALETIKKLTNGR